MDKRKNEIKRLQILLPQRLLACALDGELWNIPSFNMCSFYMGISWTFMLWSDNNGLQVDFHCLWGTRDTHLKKWLMFSMYYLYIDTNMYMYPLRVRMYMVWGSAQLAKLELVHLFCHLWMNHMTSSPGEEQNGKVSRG
jgi:hypothetical protein